MPLPWWRDTTQKPVIVQLKIAATYLHHKGSMGLD
jgi:hypothetical protein